MNSVLLRTNRLAARTTDGGPPGKGVWSQPRVSIRSIRPTLIASASNARWQAELTASAPWQRTKSEQPVDLAHLGPEQRMINGGVGANVRAIGGGAPVQGI